MSDDDGEFLDHLIYFCSCTFLQYITFLPTELLYMVSKKLLNKTVCIIGLGYVGLPLADDFS